MRLTWFLMGVVLVLAMLYTAFEFPVKDQNAIAPSLSDDMMADLELMPALDRKDMVAAQPAAKSPSTTGKIKPVDNPITQMEQNLTINDLRTVGEGTESAENGTSTETKTDDNTTTALAPVAVDEDNNPLSLHVLEQYPEFPGGMVELMVWLNGNLKYPESARKHNIQGRVVVSFIINKDGTISDARVTTSVHPLLDREALRVVKLMPKWKPGQERNKPCRTMFVIPINFKI